MNGGDEEAETETRMKQRTREEREYIYAQRINKRPKAFAHNLLSSAGK